MKEENGTEEKRTTWRSEMKSKPMYGKNFKIYMIISFVIAFLAAAYVSYRIVFN